MDFWYSLNPLFIRSQFQMLLNCSLTISKVYVSIPYSSGLSFRFKEKPEEKYFAINVSIPYSSGLSFRYHLWQKLFFVPRPRRRLNPLFIRSQFQMLIEWLIIPMKHGRVSIPYSSGLSFRSKYFLKDTALILTPSQSLIHQVSVSDYYFSVFCQ